MVPAKTQTVVWAREQNDEREPCIPCDSLRYFKLPHGPRYLSVISLLLFMTTIERRGRSIFVVLATFVVLDILLQSFLSVQQIGLLASARTLLFSLMMSLSFVTLWLGDNTQRVIVAFWCILHGATHLLLPAMAVYKLSNALPNRLAPPLVDCLISACSFHALHGWAYIAIAAALFFSTSLKAFLAFQGCK